MAGGASSMSIWDRVTDVKRLRAEIKRLERELQRLKNKQAEIE
jgi:polyhydroxyalkanoate synthesis regulator phasin